MFESWIFTNGDYYRNPNGLPDLGAVQANVDLRHQPGFLRAPLEVKNYANLSVVEEAAQRLEAAPGH